MPYLLGLRNSGKRRINPTPSKENRGTWQENIKKEKNFDKEFA